MVIVPHPSYSPDLAPCEFTLFPKLKIKLKGRRLATVSDIQRESLAVLDRIKENDFHVAFEAWKKGWDRCIHSQGDYFEGYGSKNRVSCQHSFTCSGNFLINLAPVIFMIHSSENL
jgi:hypothetical protein